MAKTSPIRKAIKKDTGRKATDFGEVVQQVRDLAWAGQHARAIELASQSLSLPKLKPSEQMDLLDLRAESYIAQGKLDLATKDARAMEKLANAQKKPALKAQALIRKGSVQQAQ